METGRQIRDAVKSTMEEMVYNIVLERPINIVIIIFNHPQSEYMIEWLQKKGGYTSNGK
jgi:hypothetical protein